MQIKFYVTKEERKALVKAVGEITGCAAVYQGAPSFAYAVNNYIIDRDGTLIYDERTGSEEVQRLLAELSARGFMYDGGVDSAVPAVDGQNELADSATPDRLAVEVSLESFTDATLENLERLISGKAALIMKAIGADSLPVERSDRVLRFAWFPVSATESEVDAYTHFIHALCGMAKTQKRVTMKEKPIDGGSSEKFAFRCFLLRLGFIGAEYALSRKVLLSKLSGSGAFKSGNHTIRSAGKDGGEESAYE